LICDGVGMGKTISTGYIIFYQSVLKKEPVLVVCPSSLVQKWKFELKNRFKLTARTIDSKYSLGLMGEEINSKTKQREGQIYIISNSHLTRKKIDAKFGLLVVDEVHSIRNKETKLHKKIKRISKKAKYRVGLSATPINNSIEDLGNIFSALNPKYPTSSWNSLIDEKWYTKNMKDLSCITTRFEKSSLKNHFTKRIVENHYFSLDPNYEMYIKEKIDQKENAKNSKLSYYEKISYYRIAASSSYAFSKTMKENSKIENSKEDKKIQKLQKIIQKNQKNRLIVFTEFKKTAQYVSYHLEKNTDSQIFTISGDTVIEEREFLINQFKRNKNSVLVLTPVGNEGLDFQICNQIVNYDLHWNPMRLEQRIGRVDRIGQEKSNIFVHNFMTKGSIDEKILSIIDKKLETISGTFVENDPIISNKNITNLLDEQSLELELKSARKVIKINKLTKKIKTDDYELSKLIKDEAGMLDNWKDLNWNPLPWTTDDFHNWTKENSKKNKKIIDLLSGLL